MGRRQASLKQGGRTWTVRSQPAETIMCGSVGWYSTLKMRLECDRGGPVVLVETRSPPMPSEHLSVLVAMSITCAGQRQTTR